MAGNSYIAQSSLLAAHRQTEQTEIREAFADLFLPVPEAKEYINMRRGALIALPYGAVIRVEENDPDEKTDPVEHPLILQPVGVLTKETYRFEICPGVPKVGITMEDHLFMQDEFYKLGLIPKFTAGDDCGYLPVKTERFPNGIPVLIDRTDIWWTDTSYLDDFNARSYAHLDHEVILAQISLYRGLRHSFNHFAGNPAPETARAFWADMKKAMAKGKLFTAWEATATGNMDEKIEKGHDLRTTGNNYEQRLRTDPVHRPLLN